MSILCLSHLIKKIKECFTMLKTKWRLYCQPEGAEVDCPDCGSDAIVTDGGIVCSNPDCENS